LPVPWAGAVSLLVAWGSKIRVMRVGVIAGIDETVKKARLKTLAATRRNNSAVPATLALVRERPT
jgi:hypothetical protein